MLFPNLAADTKGPPIPLLVTLRSVMKGSEFSAASRQIHVGCVRTMAVSQKKVLFFLLSQLKTVVK